MTREMGPTALANKTFDGLFSKATPDTSKFPGHEPFWGPPVHLAPDLWIGTLEIAVAQRIYEACEPAGYNYENRKLAVTYGFLREVPAALASWDDDGRLSTFMAISRLIQPHFIGTDFAARISFGEGGQILSIAPGPVKGATSRVYHVRGERYWLTHSEAERAVYLFARHQALPDYQGLPLPKRLDRALRNHEFAMYVRPYHVRWLLVSMAVESLIQTGVSSASGEFERRVSALAADVGVPFSRTDAKNAYKLRSAVAHRAWLEDKDDDALDPIYQPMERILSRTLEKAILDPDFRAAFETEVAINARWPVPQRVRCGQCNLLVSFRHQCVTEQLRRGR